MKQYEIRWADLPLPAGQRPVLLLSRDLAYVHLAHVLVAEITTRLRPIAQQVLVGRREGLGRPSAINFDNVYQVAKRRIGALIGRLGAGREIEIKRALGHALDWPELKVLSVDEG